MHQAISRYGKLNWAALLGSRTGAHPILSGQRALKAKTNHKGAGLGKGDFLGGLCKHGQPGCSCFTVDVSMRGKGSEKFLRVPKNPRKGSSIF